MFGVGVPGVLFYRIKEIVDYILKLPHLFTETLCHAWFVFGTLGLAVEKQPFLNEL
jgi:hypothetical protein